MTDALGWKHKFAVLAPSTNTIVKGRPWKLCGAITDKQAATP